jgi:hypothetical protein
MNRIESVDKDNWEEFVAAERAVLILATTTCENCARWSAELESALTQEDLFPNVRFGKLYVDQAGLVAFKKANTWLADVDELPYNAIYREGERVKGFAGGGIERLRNRLSRLSAS